MKEKEKQLTLFENKEWWEDHWQDMPEFIQNDLRPYGEITVKFRNRKDFESFKAAISQPITEKTKAIWYPEMKYNKTNHMRYVDES